MVHVQFVHPDELVVDAKIWSRVAVVSFSWLTSRIATKRIIYCDVYFADFFFPLSESETEWNLHCLLCRGNFGVVAAKVAPPKGPNFARVLTPMLLPGLPFFLSPP